MIARVAVEISLDREFDYLIPADLEGKLQVGSQVEVPFGKTFRRGYVLGIKEKSTFKDLKPVSNLISKKALIAPEIMELAQWISRYYVAPIEKVLKTVLPGAVRKKGASFKEILYATPTESARDETKLNTLKSVKQTGVMEILLNEKNIPIQRLADLANVTTGVIRNLEKKGFINISRKATYRDPHADTELLKTNPHELMPEQQHALDQIKKQMHQEAPSVIMLFGVTGSGKTEIYLQAIRYAIEQQKNAIVLVPEISLTPQTVELFRGRFQNDIAVLHSHLSQGERHDEWHRIHAGKARIVIGARSALFAPVKNLGLIVVDEEHEPSYKQDESPRYNARDVAVMRGKMQQCAVVLGSATPSIETYYNALRGKYQSIRLSKRIEDQKMPLIRVVDMRIEAEREGRPGVFSRELIEAMRARLNTREQTILFLNRRGFSTTLICTQCGHVAECSQCSVAMTYHRKADEIRCHICGESYRVPTSCPNPECHAKIFNFTGVGTEKVENYLNKLFPKAAIKRVDSDTMSTKNAYNKLMGDFRSGKIDIIIGTQMIAKGLHFPNVTLVGVIFADGSLHRPDFRAAERTFQLMTQVAGRAGRGDIVGEVIIQTFTPFHPAIQCARRMDYEAYVDQEVEFRRELFYPPFSHLVCVTLSGPVETEAQFFINKIHEVLNQRLDHSKARISEAAPTPIARIKGNYRYHFLLRAINPMILTNPLRAILEEIKLPPKVKCVIDVDALSLM